MERSVEGFLSSVIERHIDVELDSAKEEKKNLNKRVGKICDEVLNPDGSEGSENEGFPTDMSPEERFHCIDDTYKALLRQKEEVLAIEQRNMQREEELGEWKVQMQQKEVEYAEKVSELEHKHRLEMVAIENQRQELLSSQHERRAEMEQIVRYSEQNAALGELLRKSDEELGSTTALLTQKEQEIYVLQQDNALYQQQIAKHTSECKHYKEQLQQTQADIDDLTDQLADKEEELKSLKKEKDALHSEVQQLTSKLNSSKELVDKGTEDIMNYKHQLEALQQTLQNERASKQLISQSKKSVSIKLDNNNIHSPTSSTHTTTPDVFGSLTRKQVSTSSDIPTSTTPTILKKREFPVPHLKGGTNILLGASSWRMAKSGVGIAMLMAFLLIAFTMTGTTKQSLSSSEIRFQELQSMLTRNQQTLDSCQNALAAISQARSEATILQNTTSAAQQLPT